MLTTSRNGARIHVFVLTALVFALTVFAGDATTFAQETRGTLLGTVSDTSGAVVPGATVVITNAGTNVSTQVVSNEGGTFEVPFLQPGTYNVTATVQGFKKFVQQGVAVNLGGRSNVEVTLETGDVSEEVVVTGAAPLLDTASGSGSAVLESVVVRNMPVFGGSAILAVRSMPGIQWTGQPNYLGLHSNVGGSAISAAGGAGGTEFVLDGIPNSAGGRRAGFLPHQDAVEEVRVSSSEFDASEGHTAGATVNMVTKAGGNDYHGSLAWLHWQQRFNGTPTFVKSLYLQRIDAAEAAGNTALAQQLRDTQQQTSGRSNTYSATIGGPIHFPRFGEGGPALWSGKDKLFFFFAFNGYKEAKSEEVTEINRTVPTAAHRRGDFSDLLQFGSQYQIYDPRTARLVNGRVVRDPFPNNQVPILNPVYNQIVNLYPLPNNPAARPNDVNNYLASGTPFDWDYKAFQNRVDYNITPNQKLTGKWSWNAFLEDRGDWTYETARGLNTGGLVRRNTGIGLDYVITLNPTTFLNFKAGYNRFVEGNVLNAVQTSFSPSSIGLPSYIDERAGGLTRLPNINFGVYSNLSGGYPGYTRYSAATTAGELSKSFTEHTLRIGYDLRQSYRASNGPGQTSGQFEYRNNFVRPCDNNATTPSVCSASNNAAAVGLEWAAFMLDAPTNVFVDRNDTLYLTNPFGGFYVQDDWRVSQKLTLNLGFRYELEGGFRERFNRGIAQFDPTAELPISAASETAYLRSPVPAVSVAATATTASLNIPAITSIDVIGGSLYLNKDGAPRTLNDKQPAYMPRVGFAYQWNEKTVIRGGYGLFYDTNNVLNFGLDQSGFSRSTGTTLTNNNGLTFTNGNLSAACRAVNSPGCQTLSDDPFPLRADGTRFNDPFGNSLGLMARAGRGFTYVNRDWSRARQQRWRIAVQRELSSNLVLEAAYLGSYTDNMSLVGDPGNADAQVTRRIDILPAQYYATGLVRDVARETALNQTFPNPFNISNFASLQTQNPLVYQDISTNGFFTSTTISRAQLLRQFPQINGLNVQRVPEVSLKYHHMETSLTQRLTRGVSFMATYQWASSQVKDFLQNEFDAERVYRQNTNYRPHSLRLNGLIELPFGEGRRFFSGGGIAGKLLGGWQVTPIYYLQSGRVYDFGNVFFFGEDTRDIKLPDDERTRHRWFNTRLFPRFRDTSRGETLAAWRDRIRQLVPAQYLPTGRTYDTVVETDFAPAGFHTRVFPSRFNWLRGDIMSQVDVNIAREFPITENTRLEFRTDLINALNSVQWNNPNTDPASSDFGRVTSQYNTPRWIQFQMRLTF
ncbi:MAG TPA: carboxypeptidase-like regulatory domain-containing protein [Pyrinomonadaceae bacterium]|nr:carboxypeptidase-like regulatory domain-containing protein [Pyrinomonadaceae bacterium]